MHPDIAAMLDKYQVTEETRAFLEAGHQPMFINGQFVDASDGGCFDIEDPATGEILLTAPAATTADVDAAVTAARAAFETGAWAEMLPGERQALLFRMADIMEERAQTLAELESIDAGKAIGGCLEVDILGSVEHLRFLAGFATKIEGNTRDISFPNSFAFTLKEPVGVVGAIVPWNWPLNMALWKLAAPLTVGCTAVLKTSEMTPMSMLYLMRLWQQAGLPDGVVNVIVGDGAVAGSHLAAHPGIDKVSFTGSTPVGKIVGKAAMDNVNHVTLELGGKSAMVAFDDASVDDIIGGAHNSVYFNAGQVCSAGSRLYVQRGIYEETVAALAASLDEVVVDDPLNPDCTQGPQISEKQFNKVMDYIRVGQEEGARLVCGGQALDRAGYFIQPTLFADCDNSMRIVREEIFGPVLCLIPFDTEAEAIAMANDSEYGLAASVFTQDISRALRVVRKLEAGSVSVNTHDAGDVSMPFGGYKQSGLGKDQGKEQLAYFLETKSVIVQMADPE